MSYEQPQSPVVGAPAPPPGGDPSFAPTPPTRTTNGLAIAGFILAFLIAPIGLILSIVGLIQAGKRQQKGKVLAAFGIVISLVIIAAFTVGIVLAGKKVATLADPGCTTGRAAIFDNATKAAEATDPATMKAGLQATIDGLNSAAAKAKHDNVRDAMKVLANDYTQVLQAVNSGVAPDAGLSEKIAADANKIDSLCSLGGGK
jgi:hypothetical protein